MTSFTDLLSENVGAAFARQLAFADFLGERNWNVSLNQGTVRFGSDLEYPIQLLGTEADGDASWLWAWANEASHLPAALLRSCNELRELGERNGIQELTERSFSLEVADGHALALIASGLHGKCCYYRGPYDGGALFFLVLNVPTDVLRPVDSERALTVITQVISQFAVDQRRMVESFLKSQGFAVQESAAGISATRAGDTITIDFDDQQRVCEIGGTVQPRKPAPKKNWWQFWKES